MTEVRNPFAIKNGRIITILDLDQSERGLQCNCICPNCNGVFEARMGPKRQWHFAHSGDPCDLTKQYVNSVFRFVQQTLLDNRQMTYPGYIWYGDELFTSGMLRVNDVKILSGSDNMARALILNDGQLAIRLLVGIDYCVGELQSKVEEMSTLSIDLSNIDGLNTGALKEKICSCLHNKHWIYSIKAEKYKAEAEARRLKAFEEKRSKLLAEKNEQREKTIQLTRETPSYPIVNNCSSTNTSESKGYIPTIKKSTTYKPHYKYCSVCHRQVIIGDDALWGKKTHRCYCYQCIENKGLRWQEL